MNLFIIFIPKLSKDFLNAFTVNSWDPLCGCMHYGLSKLKRNIGIVYLWSCYFTKKYAISVVSQASLSHGRAPICMHREDLGEVVCFIFLECSILCASTLSSEFSLFPYTIFLHLYSVSHSRLRSFSG